MTKSTLVKDYSITPASAIPADATGITVGSASLRQKKNSTSLVVTPNQEKIRSHVSSPRTAEKPERPLDKPILGEKRGTPKLGEPLIDERKIDGSQHTTPAKETEIPTSAATVGNVKVLSTRIEETMHRGCQTQTIRSDEENEAQNT